MKTRILLLLSLFTALISCTNNHFREFDTFGAENRWLQTNAKTFEFEITEDTRSYDVVFVFSHVYGYQFSSVPLSFVIEDPSGNKEKLKVDLELKDNRGKELGDCAGDYCDLKYSLKRNAKLTKGIYSITVSHNFKRAPYLPNVIGIGLNVDIVK